jgi:hypothetical protein
VCWLRKSADWSNPCATRCASQYFVPPCRDKSDLFNTSGYESTMQSPGHLPSQNRAILQGMPRLIAISELQPQFQNCGHNSQIVTKISGLQSQSADCSCNFEIAATILELCAQSWNCAHNFRIAAEILKLWPQFSNCANNSEICARNFQIVIASWQILIPILKLRSQFPNSMDCVLSRNNRRGGSIC